MNAKEILELKINQLITQTTLSEAESNQLIKDVTFLLYNFSINEIKNTELAKYEGSKTDKLLKYFALTKLSEKLSINSIDQYIRVGHQLCDLLNKELDEIDKEDIKVFFIRYQQLYQISNSTLDNKRRLLSSIFSLLYNSGLVSSNPMTTIGSIKYKKVIKQPLKDEEIERIKLACNGNKRNLAIITFFLETGIRVSELCNINLADVDFINHRCKVTGKGNKERIVYFTGKSYVMLYEYLKTRSDINMEGLIYSNSQNIPLFVCNRHGIKRMTKEGVEAMVRKLREPSGVSRLHCHLFRATYATNLAKKGVSIELIAKALGHANLNCIDRYVLTGNDELELALKRIGSAA